MGKPPVIVLDACVLYPAAQRDEEVTAAFFRMRDNLRNPPKTTRECVETLAVQGLKAFSRMIGESIGERKV